MKIRGDMYGAPSIRAVKAIMTQTIILEAMEGVVGTPLQPRFSDKGGRQSAVLEVLRGFPRPVGFSGSFLLTASTAAAGSRLGMGKGPTAAGSHASEQGLLSSPREAELLIISHLALAHSPVGGLLGLLPESFAPAASSLVLGMESEVETSCKWKNFYSLFLRMCSVGADYNVVSLLD